MSEGDPALLLRALTFVRRFRSDATAKTKWLSQASRPETAQEILRQARASDADAHHPLTCEFMERFEADLVKIAAGDTSNIPQGLLAAEAIMQRIPLSSRASEGVHRQSRLVKVRAPASAIPWILASARVHQNIEWVRSWMETESPDAAVAFVFERMNAKRIAQLGQGQKGHRPVQNKWTDVC